MLAAVVLVMTGCPSSSPTDASVTDERKGDATLQEAGGDAAACTPQQTRCGAECVDTQTAFLHCGRCMFRCQGTQRCVGGTCVRAGVCPRTCMRNSECNLCSYEGDPTVWCCGGRNEAGVGTCWMSLTGRCPLPE